MKRITLLYALAATLMVCSGCSDFLEEHNRSAVTTEGEEYSVQSVMQKLILILQKSVYHFAQKSEA